MVPTWPWCCAAQRGENIVMIPMLHLADHSAKKSPTPCPISVTLFGDLRSSAGRSGSPRASSHTDVHTPAPRILSGSPRASLSPRIFRIMGAERNVLRSGSSAGREFASFIIVSRLSARWRAAKSRSAELWSSEAVA